MLEHGGKEHGEGIREKCGCIYLTVYLDIYLIIFKKLKEKSEPNMVKC